MKQTELDSILKKHKDWLDNKVGGERANLSNADLRGLVLRGVDLRHADLRNADLRDADLEGAGLVVLQLPFYTVYVQKEYTRIGSKYYSNKEWKNFSDEEMDKMDHTALKFWESYKNIIFAAMDSLNREM